jgi:hypothetical protein
VQNTIHEFTGPSGDYPALAAGPANALAERLRTLIHEESGQQSRVADSIGRSATNAAAAIVAGAGPSAPSGLQLPSDVAAALRSGRMALVGINWGAGDIAVRTALSSDLRGVAAEMNRLGAPWRIEVDATEAEGGKEAARTRSLLVQNALVAAGLQTLNGGRAVLRPTKYGAAAAGRVEVARP